MNILRGFVLPLIKINKQPVLQQAVSDFMLRSYNAKSPRSKKKKENILNKRKKGNTF